MNMLSILLKSKHFLLCIFGELWESFFFSFEIKLHEEIGTAKLDELLQIIAMSRLKSFLKGNYYFFYCMIHLHFLKLCKKARKKLIDRPFKILIHSQVKAKFDCQHLGIIFFFFSIFLGGKSVCMTN